MLIIGDVHGQLLMLTRLLERVGPPAGSSLCFVGDLVDRGPDSRGVVKFIRDGGYHTVLGNHEHMMVSSLLPLIQGKPMHWGTAESLDNWMRNGALKTLASYGMSEEDIRNMLRGEAKSPPELVDDVDWMSSLPHYLVFGSDMDDMGRALTVSHSGALPFWSDKDTPEGKDHILWDRNNLFHSPPGTELFFNVFGHTPMGTPFTLGNAMCVDTGAFHPEGSLTAVEWPSLETTSVKHIEVHPEDALPSYTDKTQDTP